MLQQHRRHCRGGSDRFGTASGSDFGSVVPAFNGAGAWNKKSLCQATDAIHSSTIYKDRNRGVADCCPGTTECASQLC